MAKGKLKIIYLAIIMILTSCNVQESIAFKFKRNNGKLTSHPEKIYKENFEVALNSIISSNQKYQGLDSELNLKSEHRKVIEIDSISSNVISYKESSEKMKSEVYERFSKPNKVNFPIRLNPNEIKWLKVIILNQDDYEFDFGDSVKVQIELFYSLENEEKSVSFERMKYYNKSRYIVTP